MSELLINDIKSNNSEVKSNNEEKQIEELTNDLVFTNNYGTYNAVANYLINKGWHKQSENTVELPCKVGDKVWCISNYTKPKEFQITILTMSENHYSFVIEANKGVYKHYCDKDSVGKYVFFTKEEAEQALAKMKGGAE